MTHSAHLHRVMSGLEASTSASAAAHPRAFRRAALAPNARGAARTAFLRTSASMDDDSASKWNASSMGDSMLRTTDTEPSAAEPFVTLPTHPPTPTPPQNDADVLIEFRDVHKSFGSKQILRGASFKIRRGEAVGIIGSSGTGKSTTLRLAAGLLQADSGEVLIKGEPRRGLISDDDTSDKLKVGLVFQSGALFDSLTVKENVGFMLYEHTSLPAHAIEAAVAQSLARVGLSGVEDFYPSELSGGMKKRVALARAIVTDSSADEESAEQLIMYDEPTAGLDPVASTVIEDLIRHMHDPTGSGHVSANGGSGANGGHVAGEHTGGGITSYVVVTHQHSTIRRAVDRIIFLHEGKVVWEGSVEEFDTTEEPIVRQFASGSLHGPIVYV